MQIESGQPSHKIQNSTQNAAPLLELFPPLASDAFPLPCECGICNIDGSILQPSLDKPSDSFTAKCTNVRF